MHISEKNNKKESLIEMFKLGLISLPEVGKISLTLNVECWYKPSYFSRHSPTFPELIVTI